MSVVDNYIHFLNSKNLEIRITGLMGIEKALNRIADELEKSNNKIGKHSIHDNPELLKEE